MCLSGRKSDGSGVLWWELERQKVNCGRAKARPQFTPATPPPTFF